MSDKQPHEFHHLDPDPESERRRQVGADNGLQGWADIIREPGKTPLGVPIIGNTIRGESIPALGSYLEKFGFQSLSMNHRDLSPEVRQNILDRAGQIMAKNETILKLGHEYGSDVLKRAAAIAEFREKNVKHIEGFSIEAGFQADRNDAVVPTREHHDDLPGYVVSEPDFSQPGKDWTVREARGEFTWDGYLHLLIIPEATLAIQVTFYDTKMKILEFSTIYTWRDNGIHIEIMPGFVCQSERQRWKEDGAANFPPSPELAPVEVLWVAHW